MNRGRNLGWTLGIALLALAIALSFDAGSGAGTAAVTNDAGAPNAVRRVRVERVEPADASRRLRFAGVTRAADRAHLSFPLGARLAERPVAVGDPVRAGQLVARLDAREMTNAVDAAAAALAEVTANHQRAAEDRARVERLFAARAATREEVDRARRGKEALAAATAAAESRLREARRLLAEAALEAPFAGIVTRVSAEPGEFVRPGQPIVTLAGAGALEVEVGLPESLALALVAGGVVAVELPLAGGREVAGRLDRVGRAAAAADGLFPAVISLADDPGVLSGMTAEVVFEVGGTSGSAVAVPLAAVLNPGGRQPAVFRLDGDRVTRVPVAVVELIGERVAVRGDLAAGREVVVTGHTSLLDGDRVEVIR